MEVCVLQGRAIDPETCSVCKECTLYLTTCNPVIRDGFLVGAECDFDYCQYCPYYEMCGR